MKTPLSTALILRLAAAIWLAGPTTTRSANAVPEDAVILDHGRRIAARAFAALSGELTRALAAGSVTNALPVCAEKAGPLLAVVAQTEGVTIRRVAERHRNPANAPGERERRVLEQFAATLQEGTPPAPVVHREPDGAAVFFAPIVLNNPLCLRCHGTPDRDIQPEDLALIRKLYPEDRATGFALNDLRGLWRVDFPAASATGKKPPPNPDQPKTNATPNAP